MKLDNYVLKLPPKIIQKLKNGSREQHISHVYN
jgi:hypothetical protein